VKILLLHNAYQQRGGEDAAVAREQSLLSARGHEVSRYSVSNDAVQDAWDRMRTALGAPYSLPARGRVAAEIRRVRPDIVHVHNFFPLLTPSVYDACRAAGVPVVQTLHNYRLLCLNALFFRDGRVCEDCLGIPAPWPGVRHGCYRGSRGASAAVAAMLTVHRVLRTWTVKVDAYIALSDFARAKFIQGGLPAHKISVKPNFVDPDPGPGEGRGGYALFVGRLSPEKGLDTLLAAWMRLGNAVPLKIIGDGPLAPQVKAAAARSSGVEWLGPQSPERVLVLMKDARALVFPSRCYENFPLVIAEAYAVGLPVIAGDLGSTSSLVDHGRTGLRFASGDPAGLAAAVTRLRARPEERAAMRRAARVEFEQKYTAERNYQTLMEIYGRAMPGARARLVKSSSGIVRPGRWRMVRALVTGAGGFIGHHLVRRLVQSGCWVRGIDIKAPEFEQSPAHDFRPLDLRRPEHALVATEGIDDVYHVAADMGGIGYITANHAEIARNNMLINAHMLDAARANGVRRFLFSSSACIYPQYLQHSAEVTPLKEEQAYPADPEEGYGWEKLFMEKLCQYYREDYGLETRVVRFHNIYGPLGTYRGGREKAPAALCRKIALAKLTGRAEVQIWGDGEQTRSFCYVEDCVTGIIKLMASEYPHPLNLGTDRLVTINELADLVAQIAGIRIEKRHIPGPQGVRGRNSDNTRLREVLGWEPEISLEEGLRRTYTWIEDRVQAELPRGQARAAAHTGE